MRYLPYAAVAFSGTTLLLLILILKTNNIINAELFDSLGMVVVIGTISLSVLIKRKTKY